MVLIPQWPSRWEDQSFALRRPNIISYMFYTSGPGLEPMPQNQLWKNQRNPLRFYCQRCNLSLVNIQWVLATCSPKLQIWICLLKGTDNIVCILCIKTCLRRTYWGFVNDQWIMLMAKEKKKFPGKWSYVITTRKWDTQKWLFLWTYLINFHQDWRYLGKEPTDEI